MLQLTNIKFQSNDKKKIVYRDDKCFFLNLIIQIYT